MIINQTGPIVENFYSIGHPAIPVYLMDGVSPIIFDAGFTFLGELYVADIKKIIGNRQVEYLFLTHSHFDHCGSVSILKQHFPVMKVVTSKPAKNILGRPNAIQLIKALNQASEKIVADIGVDLTSFDKFTPFEIEMGDVLPFPNPFRPRGVWIECDPSAALLGLADEIRGVMGGLGYQADKPFRAHITLGRYKKPPHKKPQTIKGELHRFKLDKFYLIESNLTPEGPKYKTLATFPE